MTKDEADVLVIGAGAAGLAAARDLSGASLGVRVLEARGRIGGRVHTIHEPALPVPVELGAEFIHGEPRETWELVERARLLACEVPRRQWQLRGGELQTSGEFLAGVETVFEQLKRGGGRDRTFDEFLAEHCEDERACEAARLYVEGFHAAHSERAGTRGLLKAEEASDRVNGHRQFRILSGYGRVVELLRDEFEQSGGEVCLDTAVTELRWRRGGVELSARTGGGESVVHRASRAVVTLPLGLLQKQDGEGVVRFAPELPDKRDAAKRLEVGHVARVTLRFRERFWEGLRLTSVDGKQSLSEMVFLHSPETALPVWWTALPVRAPVLVGWAGGAAADGVACKGNDFVIESALESLTRSLGAARSDVEGQLEAAYTHDWQVDPFSRGAYSYMPVGGLEAQKDLARPVEGTLFFAGEATNTDGHNATVHGAIATGHRAARELIDSLRG